MTQFPATTNEVIWPAKAVVTAGMPYGNKPLHFGHIGGVFIPADAFARFLRDRIGKDNVRFVSGTDCFGSPIEEGYRKLVEAGEFEGTIEDYVAKNHDSQKRVLNAFDISLDIFDGSGIGHAGDIHQMVSDAFLERLYLNGWLHLEETLQFYDTQAQMFLNGRQVIGRCPVQGCKSDKAYADECDLGHQYEPEDLINPISTVSETVPEMRPVANWYFDLPAYHDYLVGFANRLEEDPEIRPIVYQTIREFLAAPIIYVKNEARESYEAIAHTLPEHQLHEAEEGKQSFEIEFQTIGERDRARTALSQAGIRFRTGKCLVPFRLTGNASWGVAAPSLEGVEGLSVWCWPESLWAPISFTIAVNDERGLPRDTWRDFWCSEDARVYQFIGQDNLYFYGVAQPALFEALEPGGILTDGTEAAPLRQTTLIANHHVLFGKKKASSSGAIPPPTGDELLEHYTVEQLRAHFLALGLDQRSVSFQPKPFNPDEKVREDARVADPVLKEGALVTNVFNRLARSCFFEAKNNFECSLPIGKVSDEVRARAHEALQEYDRIMHRVELHSIMSLVDDFIRWANKYWTEQIRLAELAGDKERRMQVLIDSFHLLRIATLLMHPIVPRGCEMICEYLNFDPDEFFSWNYDFEGVEELCGAMEIDAGFHRIQELPPRFDFFKRHPSQLK